MTAYEIETALNLVAPFVEEVEKHAPVKLLVDKFIYDETPVTQVTVDAAWGPHIMESDVQSILDLYDPSKYDSVMVVAPIYATDGTLGNYLALTTLPGEFSFFRADTPGWGVGLGHSDAYGVLTHEWIHQLEGFYYRPVPLCSNLDMSLPMLHCMYDCGGDTPWPGIAWNDAYLSNKLVCNPGSGVIPPSNANCDQDILAAHPGIPAEWFKYTPTNNIRPAGCVRTRDSTTTTLFAYTPVADWNIG